MSTPSFTELMAAYPCHCCGKVVKVSGSTVPRHKAAPGYQGYPGWSGGTLTQGWCLAGGQNPCLNISEGHKHPHEDAS